jgi:hypothetical protein
MNSRLRLILFLTFGLTILSSRWSPATSPAAGEAGAAISLKDYDRLITELSEDEKYFDSDNFISNEAGYLKIMPLLRKEGSRGGVYIGVGPDQNYSYIAEMRPKLAIIVDIRRQNLIQHLYFKALFKLSSNRARFLERLFGRRIPGKFAGAEEASIAQLLSRIDAAPKDTGFGRNALAEAVETVRAWHLSLTAEDLNSLRYIARAFMEAGPDIRFSSYYRQPLWYYPDYRTLLLETDETGIQSNYLASEERYRYVRSLHRDNRIIPIVGDLAGRSALRQVALKLREWDLQVDCFYLSNVEFYLFGEGRWRSYAQNMRLLPWADHAVLIRTVANNWRQHPAQIPGYYMTTLLQRVRLFFENENAGRNQTYWDLVTRDYIAP